MDENELKNKVDKLEKEIEELKAQLKENSAKDRKHHKELKTLQQQNHKENLTWNRTGAILTPLMIMVMPMILKYFDSKKNKASEKDKE